MIVALQIRPTQRYTETIPYYILHSASLHYSILHTKLYSLNTVTEKFGNQSIGDTNEVEN
jgi:hypothetical protein